MTLIDVQDKLGQVRADLRTLFQRVSWSTEPLDAWEAHENAWRTSPRTSSPGLGSQDVADIARLQVRGRERAALIVAHTYWSGRALEAAGFPWLPRTPSGAGPDHRRVSRQRGSQQVRQFHPSRTRAPHSSGLRRR
ncbi:hypothetical protein [Streptomyces mirabilis]|uniref:hypothetical protein n=1 Tax=Streptomyces mirabilis TaxID=68239 RepID=UPI00364726C9